MTARMDRNMTVFDETEPHATANAEPIRPTTQPPANEAAMARNARYEADDEPYRENRTVMTAWTRKRNMPATARSNDSTGSTPKNDADMTTAVIMGTAMFKSEDTVSPRSTSKQTHAISTGAKKRARGI